MTKQKPTVPECWLIWCLHTVLRFYPYPNRFPPSRCHVSGIHHTVLAASSSVLERHHESYRILHENNPDKGESRDTAEQLKKPFEELMIQITSNRPKEPTEYLHNYLYPPWFVLEAKVVKNDDRVQPYLKKILTRQEVGCPGEYANNKFLQPYLSPLLDSKLNKYSSSQVQVLDHTSRLIPSRVLVEGTVYFFKPWISGRVHGYYALQAYKQILDITEASPPHLADAHICRLHGLIIDLDDDVLQHYPLDSNREDHPGIRLVGLLLTFIDNRGTLNDLAPWSDCSNEDRLRWSRQIHRSLDCLHEASVAWGDAKPHNVLIGKDDVAWLIDFGGN